MKFLLNEHNRTNNMRIIISSLIFIICISTSYAKETLVVVINETAPWKMMVDGKAQGIDINITNELAFRLGLNVEYKMLPFKRCLMKLETGEADLMGFLTYKKERTRFLRYLQPPYQGDTKIFYVRKGEGDRLQKYEDLHKLTIGLVLGQKHYEPFDNDKQILKSSANQKRSNYMMLVKGRIDALIDNDTQGPYNAHRFGLKDKIEIAPYKTKLGMNGFFALSQMSRFINRADEFDKVLNEMVQSGVVDEIIQESLMKYSQ